MSENVKENPLGCEPVGKLMMKFAVPSIIAMLVGALYNIVDQLFIGQAVGLLGNSATNVAFPLSMSCISLALLFGIGGASCFNLAMGKGETEKAPLFIGNSITMLAVCGVILAAATLCFLTPMMRLFGSPDDVLPYAQDYVFISAFGFPFLIVSVGGGHLIRADGSPRMTMLCNLIGAVINTILDAVFVLELGWEMKGAAFATIIGQIVSAVIVIAYLFRFKTVKLSLQHFKVNLRVTLRIASIGMASFFNQIAMMIVQIVLNNSLKNYGALSIYGDAIPLACAGIVMKVNQVIFSVVIGLGQGSQPIESFNYGARKYDRVRKAYMLALGIAAAISVASFVAYQLFPREILALFGSDEPEIYFEFGEKFFRIFLLLTPLVCIQPVTATFFTSIGKPIKGIFLSLTRQIIFFLPMLIVLPLFFGIDGILYTGPVADLISAVAAVLMALMEFRAMRKLEKSA
ncbi:MAG: MATE family efflux transporter [Oscillospiraceae bacterium]|nr:MATE family efflux transporter [Oscillospiraceae bacterium]